ncbi:MAG: hypothetical protein U9N13_03955, partial [Euryarchaeota archaeon]|nr:hypothetical protein [Euryarchaeota archaeon]
RMDTKFCQYYIGDGSTKSNKYCRICPRSSIACDKLWGLVVDLSQSNNGNPLSLSGTNASILPNKNNWDIVHLQINVTWNLPNEDFLHFISTGHAKLGRKEQRQDPTVSPSLTRQEPYVQAIVEMLGGMNCPEIINVRKLQKP